MPRLRFIILCTLGGFLLVSGIVLWNTRHLTGVKLGALKNMLPANVNMRLSNLILNEAGENGRQLAINAVTAHYFKEEDYFLLQDISASITAADNTYLVTAQNGRYTPEDKLVVLTGQVRTEDNLGHVLTSTRLDLDMNNGTLTSQGAFCLEDPSLNLSGQSFVYNTKTGTLEVSGRILFLAASSISPS
ncbi:MAG: LPS export ABC transporter periplasmic protein LptC [Deltaproteobacteria bacterium]|nr:LPS export ABC transporter periplasmic protein LptC [Deltaproteobacteria bacterium]